MLLPGTSGWLWTSFRKRKCGCVQRVVLQDAILLASNRSSSGELAHRGRTDPTKALAYRRSPVRGGCFLPLAPSLFLRPVLGHGRRCRPAWCRHQDLSALFQINHAKRGRRAGSTDRHSWAGNERQLLRSSIEQARSPRGALPAAIAFIGIVGTSTPAPSRTVAFLPSFGVEARTVDANLRSGPVSTRPHHSRTDCPLEQQIAS